MQQPDTLTHNESLVVRKCETSTGSSEDAVATGREFRRDDVPKESFGSARAYFVGCVVIFGVVFMLRRSRNATAQWR